MQCCLIIIDDFPKFLPHQFPENIIRAVKYFASASEVPVEINSLPAALLRTVAVIFSHKEFRARQAESVNTLLYISNHKKIVLSCRLS